MIIYRILYSIYFPFMLLHGVFFKKTRAYIQARLKERPELKIPSDAAPIWIHAASGEAEYAFSLVQKIKEEKPNAFILFSFYSPTYEKQIEQNPLIDYCLALPFDFPGPLRSLLRKVQPELVLISRTDLWPEFLNQCHSLKIPSILFSRTQKPCPIYKGAWFKAWLFKKLHLISAVSPKDHTNIKKILETIPGNSTTKVFSHGDTRWDQAFNKIKEIKNQPFLNQKFFIAGSIWPEDLKPLSQAWQKKWGCLVVAPHELQDSFLEKIEKTFQTQGLKSCRYSQRKETARGLTEDFDLIILDQVGVLYRAYLGAMGAFIGGSFRRKVHSVMESLVSQTPVIVGPYHKNNREACDFQEQNLESTSLTKVTCVKSAEDFKQTLEHLSQRFDQMTKNCEEDQKVGFYLSESWTKPLCDQTQTSPTQALWSEIKDLHLESF